MSVIEKFVFTVDNRKILQLSSDIDHRAYRILVIE